MLTNKNILGVLFDMDGVLVDSEPVGKRAFLAAIKEYGVIGTIEDFDDFVGGGIQPVLQGIMEKHGGHFVPEIIPLAYDIYERYAKESLSVFPHTNGVLKTLKNSGYKLGICSSGNHRRVNINIDIGKVDVSNISAVVSGEDVKNKKPYPDIYLRGAELLNLKPCECIAVEDAINGIIAAHSAGMPCIALTTSFSRENLAAYNPEYIFDDISEILQIL